MELFSQILQDCGILLEAPNDRRNKTLLNVKKSAQKNVNQSNNNSNIVNKINDAINNMYPAIIKYNSGGENRAMGERTIYPIAYGLSKANNPVIRAFEPKGDTVRGVPAWKFFRLDRVLSWDNIENEKFDPRNLNGVNKSGDMLMIKVYNISPFGNAKNVDKSNEFIKIGPNAITKQNIEQPQLEKDKTYSADNVINDILRNIQTKQDNQVDNSKPNDYINNDINKINAPETKPIMKNDLGTENDIEINDDYNDNITTSNQNYQTKPVYKDEIESRGSENDEMNQRNSNFKNNFVNFFKNLTDRMNNLRKTDNK